MIKKRYKDNKVAYLLLAPWLVGFIGMWLIPMCISIYYSFTDFNLLNDPQFIGAANYVRAFTPVSYTHLLGIRALPER